MTDPCLSQNNASLEKKDEGSQISFVPAGISFEGRSFEQPLEHFRFCESLLHEIKSSNAHSRAAKGFAAASNHPIARYYQPSVAALSLIASYLNEPREKIVPQLGLSHAPIGDVSGLWPQARWLPIPIAWKLTDMWQEMGSIDHCDEMLQAAHHAKNWLRLLGSDSSWMFYLEKDFVEDEKVDFSSDSYGADPHLGIARFSCIDSKHPVSACFTLSGWNTGLGTMQLGSVEIRSFGPQKFPLADSRQFGIAQNTAHQAVANADAQQLSLAGWTRCYAAKEVWIWMKAHADVHGIDWDVRWMGIEGGASFSMTFYVKAKSCTLDDGTTIVPQSLQRYQGKSQKIILDQTVCFECPEMLNVQIIPLAGVGCFWNTSFLISFEFTSSQNQSSYSLRYL